MRIIAGEFKGRRLEFLKSQSVRPTMDRVKESLFNVLGGFFDYDLGLDLFAGSGSLGFEALSRGVRKMVFVDNNKKMLEIVGKNIVKLQLPAARYETLNLSWEKALRFLESQKKVFDLIFLDPPYTEKGTLQNVLMALGESAIVRPSSQVITEYSSKEKFENPSIQRRFFRWKELEFGGTSLSFFEVKP